MTKTFWLSFHAGYACRHSGACCTAGWPIAIERVHVDTLRAAADTRLLRLPSGWIGQAAGMPPDVAGVLAHGDDGACIFRRDARCEIHGVLGHGALPTACQHFPRVCLIDDRGTFVTLSHFCPTAAAMLFEASGPARIVEGPPALPGGAAPEGLDARDALPPLRAPDRLFSLAEYSTFESQMVELLTTREPQDALERIRDLAGMGSAAPLDARDAFEAARAAVPGAWSWPAALPGRVSIPPEFAEAVGRFLAAHAFASWAAYRDDSVVPVVRSIEVALAVLDVEVSRLAGMGNRAPDAPLLLQAVRKSDLLLRHYADPDVLHAIH